MNTYSARPVVVQFVILLILYIGAILFGWFDSLSWFDIPMHLLGGAWAGSLFLFLFRGFLQFDPAAHVTERLKTVFFASMAGSFIGVLWEFFEFLMGPYFEGFRQSSVRDTLGDLLSDLLGAGLYAALLLLALPWIVRRFRSISNQE
jgi:hypothetical protein